MKARYGALRELILRRDFLSFLELFEQTLSDAGVPTPIELQAIGGEAFEYFLDAYQIPNPTTLERFAAHCGRGTLPVTERIEASLRRLHRDLARESDRERYKSKDPGPLIIETKRVCQMSWFGFAGFQSSDLFELRRSVFKSPQERAFLRALSLRFPGLHPLPNYPLDQIVDLDRLKALTSLDAWRYGRFCILDAILVTPQEGDPVAVFELDSAYHDDPAQRERDRLKNELLHAARIPLFRLRSEDPSATGTDEWYGLLTDHVLDKIDVGERIRTRDVHTLLVPITR